MKTAAFLQLAVAATLGSSCVHYPTAHPSAATPPSEPNECGIAAVELWAQTDVPYGHEVDGVKLGGVSGMDYSSSANSWVLVSDNRSDQGGAQIYTASFDFGMKDRPKLNFVKRMTVYLPQADGAPHRASDAESVRYSPDGSSIYWATEGEPGAGTRAGVFELRAGEATSHAVQLPKHLERDPQQQLGPRDNRSFEATAFDPVTGALWVGLEAPLIEDGPPPTAERGATIPIFALPGSGTNEDRAYSYELEPIPAQLPGHVADNGLSELLSLGNGRFLMLERSGAQQPDGSFRFTTRLFCAWDAGDRLMLRKAKVADINLHGSFDNINFEGLTLGPLLPDGRRSLVLSSDNNFWAGVPTKFAVFALN